MSEQARIYYGAQGMWWRPDGCGYTYLRAEAGIYSREDASSRLSGDPARQERLVDVDDPWDPLQSSRNLTELLALRKEVDTLRDQCNLAEDALRAAGFTLIGGAWVKPQPDELTAWPSEGAEPPSGDWVWLYVQDGATALLHGHFLSDRRGCPVFKADDYETPFNATAFLIGERFVRVS